MIEFDLNGRKVAFDESVVRTLRAKALAGAGTSSTLNDLAVILDRDLLIDAELTEVLPDLVGTLSVEASGGWASHSTFNSSPRPRRAARAPSCRRASTSAAAPYATSAIRARACT